MNSENQEINSKVDPLDANAKLRNQDQNENLQIDESALNLNDELNSSSPRRPIQIGSLTKFDQEELVLFFITFWLTL